MKPFLKRIARSFLLIFFLYPQVQKGIHDFEHRNDFHCFSSEIHFHNKEHECVLCDFNILNGTNGVSKTFEFLAAEINSDCCACYPAAFIDLFQSASGSRAPPAFLINRVS